MREAVRESRPCIDVAQHLGDAHPRQHTVEPDRQIACRLRNGRLHAGDVERAVFDLDAVEFAVRGPLHHEVQPLMQRRGPGLHEPGGIGLLTDAGIPRSFGGKQVVLKGAVIATARDPDVAAAQPLAQRGEHGDFIQPPVRRTIREDQFAPPRRQKRCWRALRQGTRAIAVHRLQELDRGQHGVLRHVGLERNAARKRGLNRRSTE